LALALTLSVIASAAPASDDAFHSGRFQWGQAYRSSLGACPRIPRPGQRHEAASQADADKVKRFVHGILWNAPDYATMSAQLTASVQAGLPRLDFPYLRRLTSGPTSVVYLGQRSSVAVYAVQMAGGKARGLVTVDDQGKVDASYLCEGGL
jgi:hypothetical protein